MVYNILIEKEFIYIYIYMYKYDIDTPFVSFYSQKIIREKMRD